MRDYIWVTREIDVILLKRFYGDDILGASLCTLNLSAAERARTLGFSEITLVDQVIDADELRLIDERADRIARSFDAANSELRREALALDRPSLNWDYLNVFQLAGTVLATPPYCKRLQAFVRAGDRVRLVTHEAFANYQQDSVLTRRPILDALMQTGCAVTTISVPTSVFSREHVYDGSIVLPEGRVTALSHLPTCFTAKAELTAELGQRHGDGLLDLESPDWDVPIGTRRITIDRSASRTALSATESRYLQRLLAGARDLWRSLDVGEDLVAGLLKLQQARSYLQLALFNTLSQADNLHLAECLHITNHDGGFSGPVLSFAEQRGMEVTVHPHATVANLPFPVVRHGTRLGHVREHCDWLELGVGRSNSPVMARPTAANEAQKRLIVLLNLADGEPGICLLDPADFRAGLAAFVTRLGKAGWSVGIRYRPSHPYPHYLPVPEGATLCDGELGRWLDWADTCVSVIAPTSAGFQFWKAGKRCFHLQHHALLNIERELLPGVDCEILDGEAYRTLFSRLADRLG